jgi:hypothetical protein
MTRDEETPEIEPIDNVDNDDSAEVVEAEVVAETVVDDAFVASVLDESEGDVAASIEWRARWSTSSDGRASKQSASS